MVRPRAQRRLSEAAVERQVNRHVVVDHPIRLSVRGLAQDRRQIRVEGVEKAARRAEKVTQIHVSIRWFAHSAQEAGHIEARARSAHVWEDLQVQAVDFVG